jgi:hypothetical protein
VVTEYRQKLGFDRSGRWTRVSHKIVKVTYDDCTTGLWIKLDTLVRSDDLRRLSVFVFHFGISVRHGIRGTLTVRGYVPKGRLGLTSRLPSDGTGW